MNRNLLSFVCAMMLALALPAYAPGADLTVVSTQPARHALATPLASSISVTFDRAVNPATVTHNNFNAFGRWSGPVSGAFTFSNGNTTVTLTPTRPFSAGESVMVILSKNFVAADGSLMRPQGYSWQFVTRALPTTLAFTNIATMSNRTTPGSNTRIYGASATDLDADGWLDLTTVNEDSDDLRVFMNKADGTGLYHPFSQPPFPISHEASPNEPADFNRDGKPDICVAASSTNHVWVVLGNGDGTFQSPGQQISVPAVPHGIAVLDADGDGDVDIVTANTGGDNLSLLLNNGSGVFGPPTNFDGGGGGEYGLVAGDYNNDGILDLAVGLYWDLTVGLHRGNGNGTFTNMGVFPGGGSVWQIAAGDVNGDGHMDIATANAGSNNGSILRGNGAFSLTAPFTVATVAHVVGSDLGDLDGDGDLDWMLSSFSGSRWRLFTNNGAGVFAFNQEFVAPSNPSCSIILDIDNDRDLDLALTDEIADVVVLQKNSGTALMGDFDVDGDVAADDAMDFDGCYSGPGGNVSGVCMRGDFDLDGDVDCDDWTEFEAAWTEGGAPPPFAECLLTSVPTVSAWGALAMVLTIIVAATILMRSRFARGATA